jgi:hypothetical protein
VVYGREIDGDVVTFGTTGYTYDQTFVLYDRRTESMWYPFKPNQMNALCGRYAGTALPFLATPPPMRFADWCSEHPESLVLVRAR